MENMLHEYYKLKEIKFSNKFKTDKVDSMRSMFNKCMDLEYLDLSNFDTSNTCFMDFMFNDCPKLKEI